MTSRPPQLQGRFIAACAVAAAVVSGLIYLLEHFAFHDDIGWVGALIFFTVIFFFYVGQPWIGPRVRRFFRGPRGE